MFNIPNVIPRRNWKQFRIIVLVKMFNIPNVIPRRNWKPWLCKILGGKQGALLSWWKCSIFRSALLWIYTVWIGIWMVDDKRPQVTLDLLSNSPSCRDSQGQDIVSQLHYLQCWHRQRLKHWILLNKSQVRIFFFTSAVILLPVRPASLPLKNPQRRKIIHGMGPEGRKKVERSIDLMTFCIVEKNDFCGCCLKMLVYLSLFCALNI